MRLLRSEEVRPFALVVVVHGQTGAVILGSVLDVVLPLECGGCAAAGLRWCSVCRAAWDVKTDEPHLVTPRVDPGVPVFALGRYAGPRRQAIIAVKEHGRADLVAPLARALALGLHRLSAWGVLAESFTLVPAPTRLWAARRRGGDPVTRVATAAIRARPETVVSPVLRTVGRARDSVGLSTDARQRNIAGRVRMTGPAPGGEVVVVDDVVTTGATATEAVRVLTEAGANVVAVLSLAHA